MRELVYSNFWNNKHPGTRTNLFFITFLFLRSKRELKRYFLRVLSSRDTSEGVPNSIMSMWVFSGINPFASSRTGKRDNIEYV